MTMEKNVINYVKRQLATGKSEAMITRTLMMSYKRNKAEIRAILLKARGCL